MNGHLDEWLDAYLDGELPETQRRQAEQHLETCAACRQKATQRRSLSALLQELPPATGLKPETRFLAEVGLQIPQPSRTDSSRSKTYSFLWGLAPAVILLTMVFFQTVLIVSSVISWIPGFTETLLNGSENLAVVPELPSPMSGALAFLSPVNGIGWSVWAGWVIMLLMGFLYLVWLVTWWARAQTEKTNLNNR